MRREPADINVWRFWTETICFVEVMLVQRQCRGGGDLLLQEQDHFFQQDHEINIRGGSTTAVSAEQNLLGTQTTPAATSKSFVDNIIFREMILLTPPEEDPPRPLTIL